MRRRAHNALQGAKKRRDYAYQGSIKGKSPTKGRTGTTNRIWGCGRTVTTGDGWGYRWFFHDNLNRLTNTVNAYDSESRTVYDIEDQAVYVTDANGVTVTNTYDDLGRLLTRGYPDGGVERFGYTARGLVAYTNQLGFVTRFDYDPAMRKIAETNANFEVIRYTNNAAGDLLSLTDGKNQITRWNYDEYGRVTNKLDQASTEVLRYAYDPNSRLTNRWSAAKGNTKYSYDAVGNLTLVDYPTSTDVTFAYDPLNRVTNMVDAVGTTKYAYTAGEQLWTEDGPFSNDTVTNTYLNRMRVALALQQPTGRWTNGFAYDAAKRLTNVTSPAGTFSYLYASASSRLPRRVLLPNSGYITNFYDNMARLTGTFLKHSNHTTLNSHSYSYNLGNQRTEQSFSAGSTVHYHYDNIGQLIVADSATASEDRGYYYDAAWNLNRRTNNTTVETFTVNNRNELTSDPAASFYQYDANGNLLARTIDPQEWPYLEYAYDDENQLTSVHWYDQEYSWMKSEFLYDGLGRLRQRNEFTFDGMDEGTGEGTFAFWKTTRYIYDGRRVVELRDDEAGTSRYTWGNDLSGTLEGAGGIGGLLARDIGGGPTTQGYYHADGNGNITRVVSRSSFSTLASYRYDPFGNTISQSGSQAEANPFRFSSKMIHSDTGLYYYGYRFYAPSLQRWPNRDPINEPGFNLLVDRQQPFNRKEELNLYAFVGNDPVQNTDELGLRKRLRFRGPYVCQLVKEQDYCPAWYKLVRRWCTYICVDHIQNPTEIFIEQRPALRCRKNIIIWIPYETED